MGAARHPARAAVAAGALVAAVVTAATLSTLATVPVEGRGAPGDEAVRLLFVGDIMLGRGVAPVAAADPTGLFDGVRGVVRDADLAFGNLESPLTGRAHESAGPFALEADPATADLLAGAGFDVLSLANNHAGDAGPGSVVDTIDAVEGAGMLTVGAGRDLAGARRAREVEVEGLAVAVVAVDATGAGLPAGRGPGVAPWEAHAVQASVRDAATSADLVVVSLHGGVEHLPEADTRMLALAEQLITWGADIVWGHGAHVVQPVATAPAPANRDAIVATSTGNFLFDQRGPRTGTGMVLEVLAGRTGVRSFRVGTTSHADLRAGFDGWEEPSGDAALVDGEWWDLVEPVAPPIRADADVSGFAWGDVVAASTGRVTGPDLEAVVSFRHRPGPHPVRDGLPELRWLDAQGRSAHLGIYRASDLFPVWVAGMVPAPVAAVAACDGSVALAYSALDDDEVSGAGAATWRPVGLDAAPRLPGTGTPACADVDGDGATDPVILDRAPTTGSSITGDPTDEIGAP